MTQVTVAEACIDTHQSYQDVGPAGQSRSWARLLLKVQEGDGLVTVAEVGVGGGEVEVVDVVTMEKAEDKGTVVTQVMTF